MKHAIIALALLIAACASEPKGARKWTSEIIKSPDKTMISNVETTTGKTDDAFVYGTGLGEDIRSPGESVYDTTDTVKFINSTGIKTVITPGFPPSIPTMKSDVAWMLSPETAAPFNAEIARLKAQKGVQGRLVAIGISQGGHNMLTACLAKPEQYSACVLLNPMLLTAAEWKDSFDVSNIKDPRLMPGKHFSREEWARVNPFAQLERATKAPRMFVTACKQDDFGLFADTEAWVKQAQAKGFDVTWVPNEGCSHFTPSMKGLLEFLK